MTIEWKRHRTEKYGRDQWVGEAQPYGAELLHKAYGRGPKWWCVVVRFGGVELCSISIRSLDSAKEAARAVMEAHDCGREEAYQ